MVVINTINQLVLENWNSTDNGIIITHPTLYPDIVPLYFIIGIKSISSCITSQKQICFIKSEDPMPITFANWPVFAIKNNILFVCGYLEVPHFVQAMCDLSIRSPDFKKHFVQPTAMAFPGGTFIWRRSSCIRQTRPYFETWGAGTPRSSCSSSVLGKSGSGHSKVTPLQTFYNSESRSHALATGPPQPCVLAIKATCHRLPAESSSCPVIHVLGVPFNQATLSRRVAPTL